MISLQCYAAQVHNFALSCTSDHIRRTVIDPLLLNTCTGSSSSTTGDYLSIFALPPIVTNIRSTGVGISDEAARMISSSPSSLATCKQLSCEAPEVLSGFGLPFCVCVRPKRSSLTEWPVEAGDGDGDGASSQDNSVADDAFNSMSTVVVDSGCAEAVLRGSDVFSPGIATFSGAFDVGQRVRIGMWVEKCANTPEMRPREDEAGEAYLFRHTYARNSTLPKALFTKQTDITTAASGGDDDAAEVVGGDTRGDRQQYMVFLGIGIARMDWRTVMRHEVRGVAVETIWTPFGQPSQPRLQAILNQAEPRGSGDALHHHHTFLQNYSSMVPVALLVNRLKQKQLSERGNSSAALDVLDACAAPGGKTSLLLSQLFDVGVKTRRVVCCERSKQRYKQLVQLLETHFGGNDEGKAYMASVLKPMAVDVNKLSSSEADPPQRFDGILLDPPCTGLGLRPKLVPHRNSPALIAASADYQRKLFDSCIRQLRTDTDNNNNNNGGESILVYSTCTITLEENEANVLHFLQTYPGLRLARAASDEELALCRMSTTNYPSGDRFLLQNDITQAQLSKEANCSSSSSDAPLLVLRFMPRHGGDGTDWSDVEDGVGFFVAVFVYSAL